MTKGERPLRVAMLGLRSLYGGQGGVETHVKHLASSLADNGVDVLVLERTAYATDAAEPEPAKLKRWSLPAPNSKHFEAPLHSVGAAMAAAVWRADVLHIHAVGPALVVPVGRLLGMKVVVTHHGDDFNREKWGSFAKTVIKFGERMAGEFSNGVICVSENVTDRLRLSYPKQRITYIPNGVDPVEAREGEAWPEGVPKGMRYVVCVGRLVPEKRQNDLIKAFERVREEYPDWALVLVGGALGTSPYYDGIMQAAIPGSRVFALGHQTGDNLAAAFTAADLFISPSSHEGNPIAVLEAMSAGLPILASDIPANLELDLGQERYFPLGDIDALAGLLRQEMSAPRRRVDWSRQLQRFGWGEVLRRTRDFYQQVRPL